MKINKNAFIALIISLFVSNCVLADGNLHTTISFDDATGSITGASTNGGAQMSSLLSNMSLTPEQIQALSQVQQQTGNNQVTPNVSAVLGNPNSVYLLSQSAATSAAVNPMYKRIQDAYLVMPTAVQTAGVINQLNSYDEAFHNTDMQMMMPYKERMAYRLANRYAVVENSEYLPTKYEPTIIYSSISRAGAKKGMWLRPYVSTGSINFKNGPKVNSTIYGVFVGGDSSMYHLKKSDFQYSVYLGYNGTHQSYGENSADSQGGLLGVTGSWYGLNSFASLTINAGANNTQLGTFYMNKDYPMFTAGAAGKVGYNFEFADGKFIIQPSYTMSYSFVTPFEKGTVAGAPIESKPMNVMNIAPGVKFIGNLEHGWQPYAEAKMVWNFFDKSDYSTRYIDIPSISLKPYAQYGIGLQKLWGERSTGFIQFMMRSGGRNDIAFSAGYKCDLGE